MDQQRRERDGHEHRHAPDSASRRSSPSAGSCRRARRGRSRRTREGTRPRRLPVAGGSATAGCARRSRIAPAAPAPSVGTTCRVAGMTRPTTPSPSIERLAATLVPVGLDGPFAASCSRGWPARRGSGRSPRRNRAKIRKKLRGARRRRVAPGRPSGAAGRASAPRRPPDRARLRGLRVRQGRDPTSRSPTAASRTLNVEVTRMRRVPDAGRRRRDRSSPSSASCRRACRTRSSWRSRDRQRAPWTLPRRPPSFARGRMRGTRCSSRAGGSTGTRAFYDRYLRLGRGVRVVRDGCRRPTIAPRCGPTPRHGSPSIRARRSMRASHALRAGV